MEEMMDPNIALGDPAEQVVQWAEALCTTETALPAEIAAALGADLAGVPRVGSGIMCRPPPEASWLQLVIGRDEQQVQFVEYEPAVELELERLTLLLGPYREPPRGPHESEPTVIFEEIRP